MNKKIEDQDKLLDHIIEYGGKQYIDDEIEEFDQIPELELSDEFNQRMDKMFKKAYKKEVHKEHMQFAKKVAAIAIIVLGITSITAMNVKAFREPVLNFIFRMNGSNKTKVEISKSEIPKNEISFGYIPKGYKCSKQQYLDSSNQVVYKYINSQNKCIYIKIHSKQIYSTYSKLIKNNYEKIIMNKKTYYFVDSNKNRLFWYHDKTIFTIISEESQSELLKIAENLEINN